MMVFVSFFSNCDSNKESIDCAVYFYSKTGAIIKTLLFSTQDFGLSTNFTPSGQLKGNITSANVKLNYKRVNIVLKPNSENAHKFTSVTDNVIFKNPKLISDFSIKVIDVMHNY